MDNEIDKKSIINAFPTKELFISILVRDVSLRDAIGDLLDNSVDGALRLRPEDNYKGLYVHIEIDIENDTFTIKDNCGGIPVNVAREYAFRFGRPEDAEKTKHSVGVFGIGMKRALFRLGKRFNIESKSKNSSFSMEVDIEEWKKETNENDREGNWSFKFNKYKEDLEGIPEEERGTTIKITSLHKNVKKTFGLENEITALILELQREHIYSIDKRLEIKINNTLLKSKELKILASEDFKTAHFEGLIENVKVKIYAGISEQEKYGESGGWYIFCNKRLVIGPDQTKMTGWGVTTPVRIPLYHPQYYRFRGYVFIDAEDPKELPWNTAKTGMDLDSPVYKAVLQKMISHMRNVINFLNKLKDEKKNLSKEIIEDTPLKDAIEKAKIERFDKIQSEESNLSNIFTSPEPAKKISPVPKKMFVRYQITKKEYQYANEYLGLEKPGDIGRKTFDYFWVREIDE